MRNATVSGAAKIAGMMFIIENAENVVLPTWTAEIDSLARLLCVDAFLSDLASFTQENLVVLLFDTLDEVGEELRRWILSEVVRRMALTNWENRRLVVVLAGEDIRELVYGRLPKEQHPCIELLETFGSWTLDEVREFLRVHGFTDLTKLEVKAIYTLLQGGVHTLVDGIWFATGIVERRR